MSALFTGALATLPYIRIEDEMQLEDVWSKIANQARLTPEELDFLKMQGRETQQRNAFIAGNTSPAGNLIQNFPFMPIYSEVLEIAAPSITVNIPADYKHLLFMGSCRNSNAAAGYVIGAIQFNGDTGANYNYHQIKFDGVTPAYDTQTAQTFGAFGGSVTNGSTANWAGSFWGWIPHYNSGFYKSVYSNFICPRPAANLNLLGNFGSEWLSTAKITTVKIICSAGGDNFMAGSSVSIYGLK
jgi:hypothetical protein